MDLLEAIDYYWEEHGYAPSYREIAELMGVNSLNTVHAHVLKAIERGEVLCGYTSRGHIMPRTLRVFREG